MNFLEAKRVVAGFAGGESLPFLFALSGSSEPFDLYLRAAGAAHGRSADVRLLPFNTLAQLLRSDPTPGETEVFLLTPWDFGSEADWRSGVPERVDEASLRNSAEEIAILVARRRARVLYLPAPMPLLFSDPARDAALAAWLQSLAIGLGAQILPPESFSLSGYFASGCPVGGKSIGNVARAVVELALQPRHEPKKVLVTDFDNVLWNGGIAEEGASGIAYEPHGKGYPHFVYQGFLRRLRNEGTLIAGVSRNDADVAIGPLRSGKMILTEDDFVGVIASYHAKSAQITELAGRLNLGLDAFVFVDDNPVELTEVSLALPAVRCVPFPDQADKLPAFFSELGSLFVRQETTNEDRERTVLYRRRLEGMVPSALGGADISAFLGSLGMTLTLHDRSNGDRTRAVQLINKTNQFNLNGRRVTDGEVAAALEAGGRLISASLADRTGSHGEILSCLIGPDRVITSLVMSCRVFQRRVEYAFLGWLATQPNAPVAMDWASTPRNEPFAQFVRDLATSASAVDGIIPLDPQAIEQQFAGDRGLFALERE
ncbi:MAG: HAD-IIIC family phosphatase [bacterium]